MWDPLGIGKLTDRINNLTRKVEKMAVDQATFDEHLTELASRITEFIAAVEALLSTKPEADFTEEDTKVQEAATQLQAELDKITPPA